MEKAQEKSYISIQIELVKKKTSAQVVGCSECPEPSPSEKVSTHKRCVQVEDLLCQVVKL